MVDLAKLWESRKVLPVMVVDFRSKEPLMMGYMNKAAFAYTLKTHRAWYYDAEKDEIKMKGAHSGDTQRLISIKADVNYTSLLMVVEQKGKVYHGQGGHETRFIHDIYNRKGSKSSKHHRFGKVEIDKDFDFSKGDYYEQWGSSSEKD